MGRNKLTYEQHLESAKNRLAKYSKLNTETGCIEWTGNFNHKGYGQIAFNGKTFPAHRLAFMFAENKLIDGLEICHNCNNSKCINVEHLRQDTRSSNQIDTLKSGNHNSRKLSDKEVLEIRNLYVRHSKDYNQYKLAEKFGVSATAIRYIVNNKTFNWL